MTIRPTCRALSLIFAAVILVGMLATGAAGQSVWNGSVSNSWFNAGNWSGDVVPNSATTNVLISSPMNNPVVLAAKASVANLTLMNSSVSLDITGPTDGLGIAGTSISNAGVIEINGGAGLFIDNPDVTLSGVGTINLGTAAGSSGIIEAGVSGTDILTNNGTTIQGQGTIGGNGLFVINGGTINANLSGQTLVLSTVGSNAVFTNFMTNGALDVLGLMEATSGGTLRIQATVDNANADIVANDGIVQLSGAVIQGGTLTTLNLGTMGSAVQSSATLDGSTGAGAVTISDGSIYTVNNASTTNVLGTITNNGAIQINGGTQFGATLALSTNTTLDGGGVVNLSTFGSGPALIGANATGLTLTNVDNIIQGAGVIGNNGMALINEGTIDANTPFSASSMSSTGSTGVLILSAATTNLDGLLEATNGGTLQIQSVVTNVGGVILGNDGTVALSGGTIQGGTIETLGEGVVGSISGGGTLDGSTSVGVVTIGNNSTYAVGNGSTTTLIGTIFNVGEIEINGGDDNSGTLFAGKANNALVTLEGGGTVTMNTATGGGDAVIAAQNHLTQTLLNVDNTIQGAGIIGSSGLTLINGGTVDANTGILLVNAAVTNSNGDDGGLIGATDGGTLQLQTTVNNANGNITAQGGEVQLLSGTVIQGGTLNTADDGTMTAISGNVVLDGSTSAGEVHISEDSTYTSAIGANTYIVGTINNEGTILIEGGNGSFGTLNVNTDEVDLTGGGTVTLSTAPGGRGAILQATGAGETLVNEDNTIDGAGIIGNGSLALQNGGIIDADAEGQTLTLNGTGGIVNTNLIGASDGGTLLIQTEIDNSDGDIAAQGGTVSVDSIIDGGTLHSLDGGTLETTPNGLAVLNAVTISEGSTYINGNNSQLQVAGEITNSGTIELNAGAGNSTLELNDDTTFSGGGTITLSESGAGTAAISEAFQVSGMTLTNSDNTIQGAGVIGNGDLTLENDATVDANVTGKTLTLNGTGGVTNTGLLEATNGGTLQISTEIDNDGADVTANGGTVNVGSLINGGTLNSMNGGTLETTPNGVAMLKDVTISGGSTYINGNNSQLQVEGTIINGGAIQVTAAVNNSILNLTDDTTFEGGGTITMKAPASGGNAIIEGAGSTLTNVDNTIQGVGIIGNNGLSLVNGGTIDANVAPSALTTGVLLLNAETTNSNGLTGGLLEATNGGILKIQTTVDNEFGMITASGGAVQMLNGTVIQGGTLTTTGGGTMGTTSGSVTLDGSTASGVVIITPGSTYTANSGTNTFIAGTIDNFGTIQVKGGAGANGFLLADGDATLNGGGTVTLITAAGTGNAIIEQSAAGGATLTNINNLIQGAGVIGSNGLDLVNGAAGKILANAAGQTLTLSGGTVTNSGTMQVNSGSTMTVTSTLENFSGNTLTGGTYIVNGASGTGNTGTMKLSSLGNTAAGEIVNNAATIVLNGPTASTLLVDAGNNAALKPLAANTTASSSFTIEGGYNFNTVGNFSNAGSVNIAAGSTLTMGASGASNYTQTGGTTATTALAGTLSGASVSINAGTLLGTGTVVSGNSTIAASGTLLPGTSNTAPGTIAFTGPLAMNGTLSEALTNSGFGFTTVSGALTLNSSTSILDILQAANYDPAAGTTLVIMTAGAPVSGMFGTIENATFDGGAEMWSVLYNQGGDNVELVAEGVAATPVSASWTSGSGNWTTASQWACSPGAPTCVPNNGALNTYNVTLNSSGNTLTLSSASSPSSVTVSSLTNQAGTLAIASGATLTVNGAASTSSGATIQMAGGTASVGGLMSNAGTMTGNGTISGAGSLTNTGTISADGGTLDLSGKTITNLSGGTLTSGTWQAGVASTGILKLPGNVTTNSASIALQNVGSQITNASNTSALAGLAANQGGSFAVSHGATFTTGGNFANNNSSTLSASSGGSSLTVGGNLTNSNSSSVNANGVSGGASIAVSGSVSNDATSTVAIQNGGHFSAASVTNSGNFVTGNATADTGSNILAVTGAFTNNSGAHLSLDAAGDTATFGSLTNAGTVSVAAGATLNDSLTNSGVIGVSGTYNISGGGSNSGTLSANNGGTITLNGTFDNTGAITLNSSGSATTLTLNGLGATLTGNGTVSTSGNANNAINGNLLTNSGNAISIAGGQFNVANYTQTSGSIDIGSSASSSNTNFTVNGGTATVDGALAASVSVGPNGSLNVTGPVTGDITNGGMFTAGNGTGGTFSLNGNYSQSGAGTMVEDISSLTDFSQLLATGDVSLDGTLDIALLDGYIPNVGDTFSFIDPPAVSGEFSLVNGLAINSTEDFQIVYNATNVELEVAPISGPPPVSEPGSLILLAVGLLCLGVQSLRRKKSGSAISSR